MKWSYFDIIILLTIDLVCLDDLGDKPFLTRKSRPISNLGAIRSFVFVLNYPFCLNSASDWSVIFTLLRCLKTASTFSQAILVSLSKQFCLK